MKKQTDWKNRPIKQKIRQIAFKNCGLMKCALFMPASEGYCLQEAERMGVISPKYTKLHLVERDKKIQLDLKATMSHMKYDYQIHCCDLCECKDFDNLDYIWIDLNGGFTEELYCWIRDVLSKKLNKNATICLTHSFCWRNNNWIKNEYENQQQAYVAFINDKGYSKQKYGEYFPIFLLKQALGDFNSEHLENIKYSDKIKIDGSNKQSNVSMMFYKLRAADVQTATPVFRKPRIKVKKKLKTGEVSVPKFMNVVKGLYESINLNAAYKAHATRLLNQYLNFKVGLGHEKVRVHAAVKAAVTRMQNS